MQQYDLIPEPSRQVRPPRPPSKAGSMLRGLLSGFFAFIALAAFGAGGLLLAYAVIAQGLPSPAELKNRASSFQSIRILDREGNLLNEKLGTDELAGIEGRRTYVTISDTSSHLINATIATEDANFRRHQGIDFYALGRALYYAVQEREFVSGASTIPQQLVKMVFLSSERSIIRKIREAILAAEISRRFHKDEILEIYLNELYYGNLAYGAEAAAHTYFNKDVADLTLGEASLLAGLPQLPAVYDPYTADEAIYKGRQAVVLSLMIEQGMITTAEENEAYAEKLDFVPVANVDLNLKSPHFTLYVRQQLETLVPILTASEDAGAVNKLGLEVTTTLDPHYQAAAEVSVREHVGSLGDRNASNGALVAVDPRTGELKALVGSADFDNVEIDGQVNMALAPRQPGSSIKPLVYLSTFEQPDIPVDQRWTPGTLIADISEEFPDGVNPPYKPVNYDGKERGLVTIRAALANSLNIPAVRALQQTGLLNFLNLMSERLGVTTLTRPDYGLSLSLGGGEIPLLEMVSTYATLANRGRRLPPVAILRIARSNGEILCQIDTPRPCGPILPPSGFPVVSPIDAFLITDILRDNEARTPTFGPNSFLRLTTSTGTERPAAAKTGTTNDIRDVWTIGYTPQLVTGVWVGNADRTPMVNLSGASGAAPIWNRFMRNVHETEPVLGFPVPEGLREVEICADTGTEPSEACPRRQRHWFANDRLPLPADQDLYQKVRLDKTTGKLATEFTPQDAIDEVVFKVYPAHYRQWAEDHGIAQPPQDASGVFTFEPEIVIQQPIEGESISGVIAVVGTANVPAFANYELQYGISHTPGAFSLPFDGHNGPQINGVLGHWDVSGLNDGPYTLRLLVRDRIGNHYEDSVRVVISRPTPTPIPTPTWTPPPLPTAPPTSAATETPLPTDPPTVTPTFEPNATSTATAANVTTETPVQMATVPPIEPSTSLPTDWSDREG
ncbi:transglycosylase domain-containing protein [Chloroflexi bacterium TSY]|nr:transglycosylase domain-containing protein [Chloroflexi bacterium TSY]